MGGGLTGDSSLGDAIDSVEAVLERKLVATVKDSKYYLADTRIPGVLLYDHLSLTAGITVAMVKELLNRGLNASDICGVQVEIDERGLVKLARILGLCHDVGKVLGEKTEYRLHVERGVAYIKGLLDELNPPEKLVDLIVEALNRHHLDRNPKSVLEKVLCLADSYASAGDRPELSKAMTREEFERVISSTVKLEKELFGEDKPVRLILGDVDRIKSYVFETSKIPEIRGGSQILVELEKEIRRLFCSELCEEALIYCGGGSFLAVVPASEAERLGRIIEESYLERTGVATITVVCSEPLGYENFARGVEPYDDESVSKIVKEVKDGVAGDLVKSHFSVSEGRKGFGELVASLSSELRLKKKMKEHAPFIPSMPFHRRCDSCGKRPAETTHEESYRGLKEVFWLCGICKAKRKEGEAREKLRFAEEFTKWYNSYKGRKSSIKIPFTSLDELATLDPKGRIAFLYADGNDIGDLLQRARTPAQYRHISQTLEEAMKNALFKAIIDVMGEEVEKKEVPFEVIALGGDDASVILPARYSWDVAVKLMEEAEEQMRALSEELNHPLTVSVGLLIADVKYPVQLMEKLAEDLLREAKKRSRSGERRESAICHLWLRNPLLAENAKDIIDRTYTVRVHGKTARLTGRPYTLSEAKTLTEIADSLSVPATQLRVMAESLSKGVRFSENLVLYQIARMDDLANMEKALRRMGGLLREEAATFWVVDADGVYGERGGYVTPLLDVIELVELRGG
ncbi:MAG: Cas10/Cmr2 second palm domain-containing protein [Candidatus Freyarchaeota archaeon]